MLYIGIFGFKFSIFLGYSILEFYYFRIGRLEVVWHDS